MLGLNFARSLIERWVYRKEGKRIWLALFQAYDWWDAGAVPVPRHGRSQPRVGP